MSTPTTHPSDAGQTTVGTVLIRLAGPMQAWSRDRRTHGSQGRRPSDDRPTKTGVVGLVANALGRDRADDVADLAALRFAVRADRPGTRQVDYHTSGGGTMPLYPLQAAHHPRAAAGLATANTHTDDGTVSTEAVRGAVTVGYAAVGNVDTNRAGELVGKPLNDPVVSRDDYLADAVFTAALTGPTDLIGHIETALTTPARLLHLGRAGYLPTGPMLAGVTDHTDPAAALADHPAEVGGHEGDHPAGEPPRVRVWAEADHGSIVHDQPVGYDTRQSTARFETTHIITPPNPNARPAEPTPSTPAVDMFTPPPDPGRPNGDHQ